MGNALTDERMLDASTRTRSSPRRSFSLQERVPRDIPLAQPNVEEVPPVTSIRELPPPVTRSYPTAETPVPSTHFLSNGSYSVMVTNGGGGYSRWKDMAISRYREDVTRDTWGTFFYLRDAEHRGCLVGHAQPGPRKPGRVPRDVLRRQGRVPQDRRRARDPDRGRSSHPKTTSRSDASPSSTMGAKPRRIEVTSYFEIAFADQRADQAHKSFSNLFVETEALE